MKQFRRNHVIALLLVLVTLFGVVALAAPAGAAQPERRHPNKTADEALFADFLMGELQYLTIDEDGVFHYDGIPIHFPPSCEQLRPEQSAVLQLGLAPDTPLDAGEIQTDDAANYAPEYRNGIISRFLGWLARTSWPASGSVTNHGQVSATNDHGFTSFGDRFTLAFEEATHAAFCVNRLVGGPATGMPHQIWNANDNPNVTLLTRILYFGWGGPGNVFGSNQNMGVVSTTLVLHHVWTDGHSNVDALATSGMSGVRSLVAAVRGTTAVTGTNQVLLISTNAAGVQNLLALRRTTDQDIPVTPPPPPTPTPPPPPPPGTIRVVKTSETGNVSGIQFRITGPGVNRTVTTNANGTVDSTGLAPDTTFTVTEINLPAHYATPSAQSVIVRSNQIASVSFHNTLRIGALQVRKISERGGTHNVGIQFRVQGIDSHNNHIDRTATTAAGGTVNVTNIPHGRYRITELNIPAHYRAQAAQYVTVTSNTAASHAATFNNQLRRGELQVVKTSERGNVAAHIQGIQFRVRGVDVLNGGIDVIITTNAQGIAIAKELPFGRYRITELNIHEMYQHQVNQYVTVTSERVGVYAADFHNELVRGRVLGLKVAVDRLSR